MKNNWSMAILIGAMAISSALNVKAGCDTQCLEKNALLGSGDDALVLADRSIKTNRNRMIYWYRVAAENGNAVGQHNYGVFLVSDSKGAHDCARALFWFRRAAKTGHQYSKDYIAPLEDGLSKRGFQAGCNGVIK